MGRTKGSKNMRTEKLDEFFDYMIGDNMRRMKDAFDGLEGRELIEKTTALMEFCVPKLARVEQTGKDGGAIEVIERKVFTVQTPAIPKQPKKQPNKLT